MISDDINDKIEDDFEDDFEVDEDFDDGFEEDWHGEDEDDGEPLNAIDAVDNPKAAASGDKTFLQKFFIPIVVLVIALFGGLFFLGQSLLGGGDPSEPIEHVQIPESTSDTDTASAETAQQPISSEIVQPVSDVLPELPEANNNNTADLDEQALRPMPGDTDTDQSFELVDLDAELADSTEDSMSDDALALVDDSTDLAIEETNDIETTLGEDAADAIHDIGEVPALIPNEVLEVEPEQDEVTETVAAVISTPEENSMPQDIKPEPEPVATPIATDMVNKDELDKLANENIELENEIKAQETTIEALRSEIDSLKKDLEMAKNAQVKAAEMTVKSASTDPAPTPVTSPVDAIQTPKHEIAKSPVTKTQPRKAVRKSVTWVLKSAQPGKATIAEAGSGDLKTIEIGQKVVGLGQIRSIQIENGLWVVRGSKKTVSQ